LSSIDAKMPNVFDWKRFWCPRGGNINLGDGGFLSDPDERSGKIFNPELVAFDQLAEIPCLALLGEPGIGKSWAIQGNSTAAREAAASQGDKVIHLDLRSYGSEDRLVQNLFEAADWKMWRSGSHRLHVFLDSLDECLLQIKNVAALLADELLKQQPLERLHLRIACRTARWPAVLEASLIQLYGVEGFKPYELAPLRRVDAERAAEQSGIADKVAFLARIGVLDVSSLAIKPVTLNFLIRTYLNEGDLPANQLDLYELGCKMLCEESSDSLRGAGRVGNLSTEQRLAVASRIAGVTQFANRYAVWTGREGDARPDEDVLIADLCDGVENTPDDVRVSADAIREVLNTGLFSSRGAERIGWAHQTYAEFLAARYCRIRAMPIEQVQVLLFHPEGQSRRLVPQLHELAGWVSVANQQVFNAVAAADPEALLGAAAANLSHKQRSIVVESILRRSETARWDLRAYMSWLYRKLKHPDLATQLLPYIRKGRSQAPIRHAAIDIARACEVSDLASDLVDLALDTSENRHLRISAAFAVAMIGRDQDKARLRPLALGEVGEDPDDEMKGCGLTAVWPELINASEIFDLITPPRQPNLYGAYASFLDGKLIEKMNAADLPIALGWFSRQPCRSHMPGAIDRLMDDILELAWKNLDHSGVLEGLVAALLSRIKLQDSIVSRFEKGGINREIEADDERRRALLEKLLPDLTVQDAPWLQHLLVYCPTNKWQ